MFGSLGGPELILILVIALIVFGPRKLPEIGKSMGKMLVEFRRASNDFKRTIEEEVEAEKARDSQAAVAVPGPGAAPAVEAPAAAEPAAAPASDASDPLQPADTVAHQAGPHAGQPS